MVENSLAANDPSAGYILIVDDEEMIRTVMKESLRRCGLACVTASDGAAALRIMEDNPASLIITDINMPGMDGVELVKRVKEKYSTSVIVMTGLIDEYSYENMVEIGADDFVTKPVSIKEINLRVHRVIRERGLIRETAKVHKELEDTHRILEDAYLDTIHRLAMAAEYRDDDTGDHIVRIGRYCAFFADKIGMTAREKDVVRYAAPMHDIGKIGIPDNILLKPGRLTREEFDLMKTHTSIGERILADSGSDVLQMAQVIAKSHHEAWNGSGYPLGLAKENIPIVGRLVAIFDAFDVLTTRRPYKDPYPTEVAIDILRKERGQNFDPAILDLFLDYIDDILVIRKNVGAIEELQMDSFVWSERDQDRLAQEGRDADGNRVTG